MTESKSVLKRHAVQNEIRTDNSTVIANMQKVIDELVMALHNSNKILREQISNLSPYNEYCDPPIENAIEINNKVLAKVKSMQDKEL